MDTEEGITYPATDSGVRMRPELSPRVENGIWGPLPQHPHSVFRRVEGAPGAGTAAKGFEEGQEPQPPPAQSHRGRLGAGRRGAGAGARGWGAGPLQSILGAAGQDLHSCLLPGLGQLLRTLFIKSDPKRSVKPAAQVRGGLGGKMAPV